MLGISVYRLGRHTLANAFQVSGHNFECNSSKSPLLRIIHTCNVGYLQLGGLHAPVVQQHIHPAEIFDREFAHPTVGASAHF